LLSENVVVVSVPRPQIATAESEAPTTQPEAPRQPEVAAQPEVMAREAPAPQQAEAPQQPAPEQPAPEQPEVAAQPEVMAQEAPAAQQPAPEQPAPERPAAEQPAAPSAQVAAAEVAAEAQAPEQPMSQAAPAATASELRAEAEQALAVLMPRSGEGQIRILQQAESASGGLGEGTLVLETVDYDAQGRTQVGGRAEARSRLVIYLDNKPAAHAEASASGRWKTTLTKSIAPGLHTLRVDQLTNDGQVAARVETPFSRAAVLAALPSESAVIVQPGNSLWRISRRIYGEGLRFSVIYQANREQIRDPNLIYPGQIFVVPTTN
jgi:nucleoid-associated protein YgaU